MKYLNYNTFDDFLYKDEIYIIFETYLNFEVKVKSINNRV